MTDDYPHSRFAGIPEVRVCVGAGNASCRTPIKHGRQLLLSRSQAAGALCTAQYQIECQAGGSIQRASFAEDDHLVVVLAPAL
ncbi:MAG: hypothetical protein ACPIOQ_55630, partial [Promethearchaeia archaeon]